MFIFLKRLFQGKPEPEYHREVLSNILNLESRNWDKPAVGYWCKFSDKNDKLFRFDIAKLYNGWYRISIDQYVSHKCGYEVLFSFDTCLPEATLLYEEAERVVKYAERKIKEEKIQDFLSGF